ncbi:hypothetical protein F5Y10DRAFT_235456 [Nemania abortiva]|nr:hypothetical protein F5Y10DRAFT_235456 [Nemania abortiva]
MDWVVGVLFSTIVSSFYTVMIMRVNQPESFLCLLCLFLSCKHPYRQVRTECRWGPVKGVAFLLLNDSTIRLVELPKPWDIE